MTPMKLDDGLRWRIWACIALGKFSPPPPGGLNKASRAAYVALLDRSLLSLAKAGMARLGQIWLDPELPDTWEAIVQIGLLPRMTTVAEYQKATEALDTIAAVAGAQSSPSTAAAATSSSTSGGSGGNAALAATAGVTAAELESAQTWVENTQGWMTQTLAGDFAGGWNEFTEGWSSFWSGNWW